MLKFCFQLVGTIIILMVIISCSSMQRLIMSEPDDSSSFHYPLLNSSFEDGLNHWYIPKDPVFKPGVISEKIAHSGKHSAYIEIDSDIDYKNGILVWGLMQEITTNKLPDRITGNLYVEDWEKGTHIQYIHVLIFVEHSDRPLHYMTGLPAELSYVLYGMEEEPYPLGNRKTILHAMVDDDTKEWHKFNLKVREGFEKAWGKIPEQIAKVRIFIGGQYAKYNPDKDKHAIAKFYFDNLKIYDIN